jgi:hypothetical protein
MSDRFVLCSARGVVELAAFYVVALVKLLVIDAQPAPALPGRFFLPY